MKVWVMDLILAAVIGRLSPRLLPRGDKAALAGPLRFLAALAILTLVTGPLLKLSKGEIAVTDGGLFAADEAAEQPELLLLRRSEEALEKAVRSAFPRGDYEIEFEEEKEEALIRSVRIQTEDRLLGEEIASWLVREGLAETQAGWEGYG